MIKAQYYLNGVAIKSVKFEHDKNGQPLDKKVIHNNAPEEWDTCEWDQGVVKPKKHKKQLELAVEAVEAAEENTDNTGE